MSSEVHTLHNFSCSVCGKSYPDILMKNPFSNNPLCFECNRARMREYYQRRYPEGKKCREDEDYAKKHRPIPEGHVRKYCKNRKCRKMLFVDPTQEEIECEHCHTFYGISITTGDYTRGDNSSNVRLWYKIKYEDHTQKVLDYISRKRNTYTTEIARNTGITFFSCRKIVDKLEKDGIIYFVKKGQTKYIKIKSATTLKVREE